MVRVSQGGHGCSSQGGGQLSEQKVGVRQTPESQSITITEEVIKNVTKKFLQ